MTELAGSDENALVVPDAWRRVHHPRRDRPGVPAPPAPAPAAAGKVRQLVDRVRDEIEDILALPGTPPATAEAARAHLRGEPDPRGAAAVALAAAVLNGLSRSDDRLFTTVWTADHGVPFAAAAFAELGGMHADFDVVDRGRRWNGIAEGPVSETWSPFALSRESARWLRMHLAASSDEVYAEAVEGLARRRDHLLQRLVGAYLAPTRRDWVEELCANPGGLANRGSGERWMLLCALGEPHQLAAFPDPLDFAYRSLDVIATLVDGVGFEPLVPLLAGAADEPYCGADVLRTMVDVLAALPSDAAFQALADRVARPDVPSAVVAAARRFPARAMRLLPGAAAPQAADLLSAHVRAHPGLAEEMLPGLPAAAQTAIRAVLDANARLPEAADLPPLLSDPPWTRPRAKTGPVVIQHLPSPGHRAVAWEPGEREAWLAETPFLWADTLDHEERAAQFAAGTLAPHQQPVLFVRGPEDLARPLLAGWEPPDVWEPSAWMRVVVARFEADAAGAALLAARHNPAGAAGILLPLLSDEIVRTMADWLARLKDAGRTARAWFTRHGLAAVPALLPDALGKAGAARRAAEAALRMLAARHGAEPIFEAARVHGGEAAAAIEAMLAADPLDNLPGKIPAADWADPRVLPQILLRDRAHALPDGATGHVLTMLAMSKPGDAYAGVHAVRELCDPDSLAEFGWALFRWWETCGARSKDGWALTQLALTGDDETVRRLTPVIRAWPGEGGHSKAVTGLDVLAAIGTDTALMHLHAIAQRVKFKALKRRAQEKIGEVAAGLELTPDQLADRLVPDFGLDASGTLTLDYGPRRFTVGFDEQLRPTITDEDGKARRALPKPGAKDDPELAPAAHKRFSALKKDVRTVAADLVTRLETAMVTRRRWPLGEFRDLLAGHPLVRHLVGRLVWLAEHDGRVIAFRVAEDGTYADAADDTLALPDRALIGIAHPLDLGGTVPAWSELLADYEILQPFRQLARTVHTLTGAEREAGHLERFAGLKVPARVLLGLTGRGWDRGAPQDAGVECWISRRVGPGRHVVIDLDPGLPVGDPDGMGDQTIDGVGLRARPESAYFRIRDGDAPLRFGDLHPVTASEILADLHTLLEQAS
ncbi:DUF4132 domain-containing protein [Actinomadura rugatobispora]|uniref:DUF4132 domain-containing protein n=1 Tax=Actinomadura rugatobispora TaxID=1994 RepID=A0ABW0ZY55_9ACTN|nr:WGR and DUF4132 domain-containing protein [Actinomadura rugatobispora]